MGVLSWSFRWYWTSLHGLDEQRWCDQEPAASSSRSCDCRVEALGDRGTDFEGDLPWSGVRLSAFGTQADASERWEEPSLQPLLACNILRWNGANGRNALRRGATSLHFWPASQRSSSSKEEKREETSPTGGFACAFAEGEASLGRCGLWSRLLRWHFPASRRQPTLG